ncbi:MAG: sulfotransferase, partial [Bacteroidota bacterium]
MIKSIVDKIKSGLGFPVAARFPERPKFTLLTGVPRSGTTLCCYLLSQIPDVVALNESIRVAHIEEVANSVDFTMDFMRRNRRTLLKKGFAVSRATKEGFTDNNFASIEGARKTLVKKQRVQVDKSLSKDLHLIVKHNAFFTMLLPEFQQAFPVHAIIRNPLAVLGSWNSLDIPVSRGEVRAARKFAPKLQDALDQLPDLYDRQLFILDWYFDKYRPLSDQQIIRYEALIASNGAALQRVEPKVLTDLNVDLSSKNKSKLYDQDLIKKLAERLLKTDNAC